MIDNIKPLGDLSPEQFLKEYWQKKTLVIRNAFPDFESPITPEELAGLSCEEEVNSRIVIEKDGNHPWQPIYGPMDDDVFSKLPETHWTLLVNDVEKHIPELAWIVDQFRFIPEWRMDDLMISYAPEGGSVGPHMDLYDVFILQAQGHRRWQINSQPVVEDNQVKGTPLRIQKDFVAEEEWLLAPGDLIYIPPGVSHYGVATDDCMSFSIGFRATSHAELVNDFIGYITQDLDTSLTYRDPDLKAQNNPNEITTDAIDRVRNIFKDYLDPDNPKLAEWFGRFVSDTKTDMATQVAEEILNISE
ncbi:MAG: cupin domain-containing protein, partial [Gammaproteobacteria bacterium]|nr:cupin domain-containing protein [Gammaproteobacteria bacterium]